MAKRRGNNRKHAKQAFDPSLAKIPKEAESVESVATLKFCWRIKTADFDWNWGWAHVDQGQILKEIIPKLQEYEASTWAEIEGHNSHFIPIDSLIQEAQERLVTIGHDDLEELFSLRITGRRRLWGFRLREVLHVLWWDPEHQICPSRKKNT